MEDETSPAASPVYIPKSPVAIDSTEEREVGVTGLPVPFFEANADDDMFMTPEGQLSDLMVPMVPEIYLKYVTTGKREKSCAPCQASKSTSWVLEKCEPLLQVTVENFPCERVLR